MENITFTLADIAWVLGFIITIGGAWVVVKKIPLFNHEKRISELEKHQIETWEMNKLLCKGVKALLKNARTGNGVEDIKATETEIDQFLIDK